MGRTPSRSLNFILILLLSLLSSCKKDEPPLEPLYSVDFTYSFDNQNATAPVNILFVNSSRGAVGYEWDFGDFEYSNEEDPIHNYDTPGEYEVSLVAFFPDGGSLTKSVTIKVLAPLMPNASFTADPDTGFINLPISFFNTSSNAVDFLWDFGDGSISNQQNPVHTYSTPGIYTVTLIAENTIGQTDSYSLNIYVTSIPFPTLNQISLSQLLSLYQGNTTQLPYGDKIVATVVSDRVSGNIASPRNMIVWDGTVGIVIRMQSPHTFNLGDRVVVNLHNCFLKNYFGNLQLDSVPASNIMIDGTATAIPITTTLSQIMQNPTQFISGFVRINNLTISGGTGIYAGTLTVSDGTSVIPLYTYPTASFANQQYPTTSVNLSGLVQLYNGAPQLLIRNLNDIQ